MRKLLIYILLIISTNIYCQNTNIDLEKISILWSSQLLNTRKFQNGDSIYFHTGELKDFISVNRPAYTIHNGVYFYNWRAVNDNRKILPEGFILPSFKEFEKLNNFSKNLKISKINFEKRGLVDPSKTLFFLPAVGYVDEAGYANIDLNSQSYWTSEKLESNLEYSKSAKFFKTENNLNISIDVDPMYSDNGLPVLYIQDINNLLKSRVFSYDTLMPLQYENLINSIKQTLVSSFNNDVRVNIKGNIEFSSNGINKSKFNTLKLSSFSNIDENELLKKLNLKLISLENPLYQGNNLLAQKNLSIDFSISQQRSRENTLNFMIFRENNISTELKNNLIKADELYFKNIKTTKSTIFNLNGVSINEPNKNYITKFIAKGPIYSLYSIIPGLAILNVEPTRKKIDGSKMIHYSIPIGTIALGTLLYSNYQYNNYKNSLDQSVYSRANSMHKVFLTTLTTYFILGVIDFTRTFVKGIDNVRLAKKINKEIKEKHNGGLFY